MANNCTNCYSAHQRLGNTWTLKHMYRANNYNPFMRSNKIPFGPPGCVATGYRLPSIKEGYNGDHADDTSCATLENYQPEFCSQHCSDKQLFYYDCSMGQLPRCPPSSNANERNLQRGIRRPSARAATGL